MSGLSGPITMWNPRGLWRGQTGRLKLQDLCPMNTLYLSRPSQSLTCTVEILKGTALGPEAKHFATHSCMIPEWFVFGTSEKFGGAVGACHGWTWSLREVGFRTRYLQET